MASHLRTIGCHRSIWLCCHTILLAA